MYANRLRKLKKYEIIETCTLYTSNGDCSYMSMCLYRDKLTLFTLIICSTVRITLYI